MKLTIDLPATLDEIEHFCATCRSLGLLGGYQPDLESFGLIANIDFGDITPTEAPAPAKVERVAKRKAEAAAAPQRVKPGSLSTAKAKSGRGLGEMAETIIDYLRDECDGRFVGNTGDLARTVSPSDVDRCVKTISRLGANGTLRLDKGGVSGRVVAVALPGAKAPAPAPALQSVPTPPVEGLATPAGGWA